MEYKLAAEEDAEQIYKLVQNTIITVYPKYYPKEVVDFFCELHNKESISRDIGNGYVYVLMENHKLLGTGSYEDNHITRVYVEPDAQGNGYGSFIMKNLENEIAKKYDTAILDASLPASHLYEKRGYKTTKHERWNVKHGVILVYEVMEKLLHAATN